jgi:predicted transcriptional regulator
MRKKAKVRLTTDGVEGFVNRACDHARKLDRGEKWEAETVISFEGAAEMTKALAKERLRLLRVNKKAPTISALMRSLKHVKSSGPYTRDEMNER